MIKKLSVLALAGLIALPSVASAASNAELEEKIEELAAQLADMEEKSEGWDLASRIQISGDIRNRVDYHSLETADHYMATGVGAGAADFMTLGTKMVTLMGAGTNLGAAMAGFGAFTWLDANRAAEEAMLVGMTMTAREASAMWSMMNTPQTQAMLMALAMDGVTTVGDFAAMVGDFQATTNFMKALSAETRKAVFTSMSNSTVNNITNTAYAVQPSQDYENETNYTTRLRMNMRVKATENIEIKARAVAYKFWGNQTNQNGETDEFGTHVTDANPYFLNSRSFDGTVGRQPSDSSIVLDRAFMNWNNIGGVPVWFSIGRRPTTDGPPAELRMGADQRMATPVNYMDYPFDGVSLGYAYSDLLGAGAGRIRFCYGRGFEAGSAIEDTGMNDVDFAGLSWDVFKKGSRFMNIQAFGAFNIFNVPGDTKFPNPYEQAGADLGWTAADFAVYAPTMNGDGFLDRKNMGNIFHTAAVYMDEIVNLNYFATLGWSRTDPNDDTDEMGISLLGDSWSEPEDQDGYGVYVGVRYDLDDLGLKLGAEYNWGSKYWLAFTPGHDDMYSSKLQTRGSVYEFYMIYDLPGGEAISKYGKAFMRLGYQHYDYEYSYSGMWLGEPQKIDELDEDPMYAQFYAPTESMDQVYLTLEAYF
jgi:hypothetical protein